jgi:hypothetical protein
MASVQAIQALCQAISVKNSHISQLVISVDVDPKRALSAFKKCTRTFVVRRTNIEQSRSKKHPHAASCRAAAIRRTNFVPIATWTATGHHAVDGTSIASLNCQSTKTAIRRIVQGRFG